MEYIMETHNLVKSYKNKTVVNSVNIHVKKGEIYGFVGPNGAGKSIVMKMLLNLTQPDSGDVYIFGEKIGSTSYECRKVGNVLALLYHIHSAKNDVVMQVAFVYMCSQHIGVFALQHFVGKLPPDLMGLLRRVFPRLKGLYQVMGQIVAFVERLRQQHLKFNIRCFVGIAKGRYQHFIVRLVRVFDVVKGRFQIYLDRMDLCNCHIRASAP